MESHLTNVGFPLESVQALLRIVPDTMTGWMRVFGTMPKEQAVALAVRHVKRGGIDDSLWVAYLSRMHNPQLHVAPDVPRAPPPPVDVALDEEVPPPVPKRRKMSANVILFSDVFQSCLVAVLNPVQMLYHSCFSICVMACVSW